MIGLSLSFCVADILAGKVALGEVDVVYAAVYWPTTEDFEAGITRYAETYWRDDPEQGKNVARALRQSGRIIQPLARGHEPFNISKGHWTSAGKIVRLIAAVQEVLADVDPVLEACCGDQHPLVESVDELTTALERAFRP